jgi:hypothetical protein
MRRTTMSLACLFVTILIAISAVAQMPMPKPAPELAKLDYLAGNWIGDGDMKPGPMGPGGKITSTDNAQWMDGKFFMVMHSKFKGAMGDGSSTAFFGYNPDKKVYTYNEFNSMGQATYSEGTVNGDTWNWTSDEDMGGQKFKGRFTMKVLTPTSYTYKFEMSQDGTSWTTVMEGKATKK